VTEPAAVTNEPDISQPLPDRSHELLRQHALWVSGQLADIRSALSAVNIRDDANEVRDQTSQADVDDMQVKVAGLTTANEELAARVEALETPPASAA
jgi:hypothetical protein